MNSRFALFLDKIPRLQLGGRENRRLETPADEFTFELDASKKDTARGVLHQIGRLRERFPLAIRGQICFLTGPSRIRRVRLLVELGIAQKHRADGEGDNSRIQWKSEASRSA